MSIKEKVSSFIDNYFKWIITIPAVILLVITAVVPTIWLLIKSTFRDNLMEGTHFFVGFQNFIDALSNPQILRFLGNTVIYVLGSVGVGFFIALILARLLAANVRFRTFFLVCLILPWVFPKIAGAIMWQWMIHQMYGVLNYILMSVGLIDNYISFMTNTKTSFLMLTWVDLWYWTPFALLVLFGGFTRVPKQLIEAAKIDGAGIFQIFTKVEIPFIMPEILTVLLLRTMFSFREFGIPFVMGQGAPARTTEIFGLTIYKTSVRWLEIGMGSALAVILLIIMVIITLFYFKVINIGTGLEDENLYE